MSVEHVNQQQGVILVSASREPVRQWWQAESTIRSDEHIEASHLSQTAGSNDQPPMSLPGVAAHFQRLSISGCNSGSPGT